MSYSKLLLLINFFPVGVISSVFIIYSLITGKLLEFHDSITIIYFPIILLFVNLGVVLNRKKFQFITNVPFILCAVLVSYIMDYFYWGVYTGNVMKIDIDSVFYLIIFGVFTILIIIIGSVIAQMFINLKRLQLKKITNVHYIA